MVVGNALPARGRALLALSRSLIEPWIKTQRIDCRFACGGKLVVCPDTASLDIACTRVVADAMLGRRSEIGTAPFDYA